MASKNMFVTVYGKEKEDLQYLQEIINNAPPRMRLTLTPVSGLKDAYR
jgi:hypothetical protein